MALHSSGMIYHQGENFTGAIANWKNQNELSKIYWSKLLEKELSGLLISDRISEDFDWRSPIEKANPADISIILNCVAERWENFVETKRGTLRDQQPT